MKEIAEDQKSKAAFQFKAAVSDVLYSNFDIYGLGVSIPGSVEVLMELAVLYAKRMRGIDVPINHEIAKAKLRTRGKYAGTRTDQSI